MAYSSQSQTASGLRALSHPEWGVTVPPTTAQRPPGAHQAPGPRLLRGTACAALPETDILWLSRGSLENESLPPAAQLCRNLIPSPTGLRITCLVSTFKTVARNYTGRANNHVGSSAWGRFSSLAAPWEFCTTRSPRAAEARGWPLWREQHVLILITLVIRAQVFEPQPATFPPPGLTQDEKWVWRFPAAQGCWLLL